MRWKKCKRCGEIFQAQKEWNYMCPPCADAARRESVMRVRVCTVCGSEFVGSPNSKYCQICRVVAARERAAKYRKHGYARHRGDTDTCTRCGAEYIIESGLQKYCKQCTDEAYKEKSRPRKIQYNRDNRETQKARNEELRKESKVCVICGKTFTSSQPNVTCSPKCAETRRKQHWAKADAKRRGKKENPQPAAEHHPET